MRNSAVRRFMLTAGMLCLGLAAEPTRAAIVFSDDFDTESLALNHGSFTNWTSVSGTTDTIGNGFHDFLPGNGVYVDLDGTALDAGFGMSTPLTLAPGRYALSFDLAGSQRGDTNIVTVSVGTGATPTLFATTTLTLASEVPFTANTLTFVVSAATSDVRIMFMNDGGDNVGALLDRVVLEDVVANPEPSTLASAGIGGLIALGVAWRRRRRVA